MNDMQMQAWTIEMDVPMIEFEPMPETRREPRARDYWFTELSDEAPTKINGKIRVFGEPITLTKRDKRPVTTPEHGDGPGPSLESVITSLVRD